MCGEERPRELMEMVVTGCGIASVYWLGYLQHGPVLTTSAMLRNSDNYTAFLFNAGVRQNRRPTSIYAATDVVRSTAASLR